VVTAVCVTVCLPLAAFPHYCTDPDVTWQNGRGCPLFVHYWADLQSVHGFRCYYNIAPNAKSQLVVVLALCLVKVLLIDWASLLQLLPNFWPMSIVAKRLDG